jgi:hypothetical protein
LYFFVADEEASAERLYTEKVKWNPYRDPLPALPRSPTGATPDLEVVALRGPVK